MCVCAFVVVLVAVIVVAGRKDALLNALAVVPKLLDETTQSFPLKRRSFGGLFFFFFKGFSSHSLKTDLLVPFVRHRLWQEGSGELKSTLQSPASPVAWEPAYKDIKTVQLGKFYQQWFYVRQEEQLLNRGRMKQTRWFFRSCGRVLMTETFSSDSRVITLLQLNLNSTVPDLVSGPSSTKHKEDGWPGTLFVIQKEIWKIAPNQS